MNVLLPKSTPKILLHNPPLKKVMQIYTFFFSLQYKLIINEFRIKIKIIID